MTGVQTCALPILIDAVVAISGAKSGANCVGVAGMRILNIHGEDDTTAPMDGGSTAKKPQIVHDSVAVAGRSMVDQGATFKLITVPGAGHMIPGIDQGMQANGGIGLPMTILNFIFGS